MLMSPHTVSPSLVKAFGENVVINAYGTPLDWTLRRLKKPEDARSESELCERLEWAIANLGAVTAVLAPSPMQFNGRVCAEEELTEAIKLPRGGLIKRGAFADGVELKPGQAFMMSSADCFLVVARSGKRVVAAHAGRDSVLNRKLIESGDSPFKYKNVVASVVEKFPENESIEVFVGLGFGNDGFAHPWDHRKHGAYNRLMTRFVIDTYGKDCVAGAPEEGRIKLGDIIVEDFVRWGVPRENITRDAVDTSADSHNGSGYTWHSHRRGDTTRNLVIAAHVALTAA